MLPPVPRDGMWQQPARVSGFVYIGLDVSQARRGSPDALLDT